MHTDWNFVLNVMLLVGVLVAIWRIMRVKSKTKYYDNTQSNDNNDLSKQDEIIAVRKVSNIHSAHYNNYDEQDINIKSSDNNFMLSKSTMMIFLLAKDGHNFAGYDFLHIVLSSGLRFGEGQLFHRHQDGAKGPIMCSLAAATASGVFDLQKINDFNAHGLCLFMQFSGNTTIDTERFVIMHQTAQQLGHALNARLLDENRNPLTEISIQDYYQKIAAN